MLRTTLTDNSCGSWPFLPDQAARVFPIYPVRLQILILMLYA